MAEYNNIVRELACILVICLFTKHYLLILIEYSIFYDIFLTILCLLFYDCMHVLYSDVCAYVKAGHSFINFTNNNSHLAVVVLVERKEILLRVGMVL